jgi:hypothetical protein
MNDSLVSEPFEGAFLKFSSVGGTLFVFIFCNAHLFFLFPNSSRLKLADMYITPV